MRKTILILCLFFFWPAIGVTAEWHIEELENGLKVMILENHQVPQLNISTSIKVGAKNETDYFEGATHFLEHLILFRGTEKMTGEEVGEAMTKHGAYFNGTTSSDWTDFVISLPKEYLDFAFQIHADMLFRSNFPEQEMDKERQIVIEEINRSEDNPEDRLYWESQKPLYGKHGYSKEVLGTKEKIRTIPRDSVYAYYKRYYAPNNMTMVVVGDIDTSQIMELIKKYFGDFPTGSPPEDYYNQPPVHDKVTEVEIKKDVGKAYLMMSSIGPKADSPDQCPLAILANVLGSGESSRLWKKLKTELGLVYDIEFDFYTRKYDGMLYASASLNPVQLEEVEKMINEVLAEVKQNGFTEKELRKAKNSIKTEHYLSMERGLDIADSFARYDSFIGHEYLFNYPENIEKVTLAQLNEAARKYLNTQSYVRTTVVPK